MKKTTVSSLEKKLDKIFSEYVRRRDAIHGIVRCCTCAKLMYWNESHCGHFMSRRYKSTRYDEKNTAVQCPGCNTFNQGRQFEMSMYLDEIYGDGTAKEMMQKSKMLCKRDRYDLEVLIDHYKKKLKEL